MYKVILTLILCLVLSPTATFAHHPAEDIVDEEIFAFIDEMVSDTPHATLDFDEMGNMLITTEFVSTAEALNLIDQIRGPNPALARVLSDLAQNYEYKQILAWIGQSGGLR